MLLAIDQGNTNTVFALIGEDGAIRRKWRIATDDRRTADEYLVWIHALFALEGWRPEDVDDAIIATVVPQGRFALWQLCRRYFDCEPLMVGSSEVALPISVRVRNPDEVGADRLVNAVAACTLAPGAKIVIDFGTATTFDVVAVDGGYEGGVIAPGINLSLKALHEAAAKLPRIAVEAPTNGRVVGRSTLEAMQSGVFWGYVGLIEGLVARIRKERAGPMTVIATGGLAAIFQPHTQAIDIVDHDLTIKGLAGIYAHNRPQAGR